MWGPLIGLKQRECSESASCHLCYRQKTTQSEAENGQLQKMRFIDVFKTSERDKVDVVISLIGPASVGETDKLSSHAELIFRSGKDVFKTSERDKVDVVISLIGPASVGETDKLSSHAELIFRSGKEKPKGHSVLETQGRDSLINSIAVAEQKRLPNEKRKLEPFEMSPFCNVRMGRSRNPSPRLEHENSVLTNRCTDTSHST
ncbi:hypothetical protein UY3_17587 [Chelonia mydas]|uniref:Uncharacterized protein n=1 Tax=Chelonia mydas TaxID=8469 RepID=M7AZX7_CHEMY|nr:hypothetical protein UY3_17587 [Chelonia mydas]